MKHMTNIWGKAILNKNIILLISESYKGLNNNLTRKE